MSTVWRFAAILCAGLATSVPLTAQSADSLRVVGSPVCAECRLVLHPVLEIGDSTGDGRLDRTLASWARDSRGRIYLAGGSFGRVRVFDAQGRFLRTLADSAAGDEAAPAIGLVALAEGDTLHLLDDLHGERRILDADFNEVRRLPTSEHLRASPLMLMLPGGDLIASGTVATRDAVGYPLHRVGIDGEVRASFGSDAPRVGPGLDPDLRKLARTPGGVWAGFLQRYRIERWTLEGRRELTLVRDAPWFEPYARARPAPGEPPRPTLMALREDARGRLWTLVRVADPAWERATVYPVDSALRRRDPVAQYDLAELYDTIVEVFDVRCGTLLLSERLPMLVAGFLDDDHLLEWRVRGVAAPPRLGVWRVEPNLPQRSEEPCRSVP
jgi:hypothetical protein